jgi:hypothetical protein
MERARKKAADEEVEYEDDTIARPVVNVVRLQVRLHYGEVTEATTVLLLSIVREAMESVPRRIKMDLDLGIVEVDKALARWASCLDGALSRGRGGGGRGQAG